MVAPFSNLDGAFLIARISAQLLWTPLLPLQNALLYPALITKLKAIFSLLGLLYRFFDYIVELHNFPPANY